ncbi:SulP family sulfate permease [Kaistia hirudinis]|uniref:SulP family sulfate permease n=1 Tax=Kaistia hirudinis TaxID=1293440 RepID=A0A840AM68_9HYPH|nr:SulP family inorganic anion transporter [Kaistia hirudinis]MBB3930364.1 SulP family sulfate permease [Kaistia hirudinis]
MSLPLVGRPHSDRPSFASMFTPKLVTILREGYHLSDLKADAIAGLTVAIVALPLSMALAIAAGTTPDRGLYASIVGGFLVSVFGGSRFQIGGPSASFIIVIAATGSQYGFDGVLLATMMAGILLAAAGFLRLGTYVKFIPYPVTVGFTAGIAAIIFAGQIKDLLGLTIDHEPAALLPKLAALADVAGTFNPAAIAIAALTILIISGLKRFRPGWPGLLFAVVIASIAAAAFSLPVETIGTRFGGIPSTLPVPRLPDFTIDKAIAVFPAAVAIALLGAIESLLSAVVSDSITGRRHRSNCELVAQGIANFGSALFGGLSVAGVLARTATNVRAGAHGPVAGMLHSAFLLAFMLVAAPLASYVPLPALAGVLAIVAWNMAQKHEFAVLLRSSHGDAVVLLSTFLLTVFKDITLGIVVGFTIGALLFINRMSQATAVETQTPFVADDTADDAEPRTRYNSAMATDKDIIVYRITGAFFFAAASSVGSVLDSIADQRKTVVIDFSAVPFLDSTAANTIYGVVRKAVRHGTKLYLTGTTLTVRQTLLRHDVTSEMVSYRATIEDAISEAKGEPANEDAVSLAPV